MQIADLFAHAAEFKSIHRSEIKDGLSISETKLKKALAVYLRTMEKGVEVLLRRGSRPDRHKRASAIEMSIMDVCPVHHRDDERARQLNAMFAMSLARATILSYWWRLELDESIVHVDPFEEAHLLLLYHLSDGVYPIVSNACTWYLYDILIQERYIHKHGGPIEGDPSFV